jgi:protein tyrosine phosphatase
MVWEQGSVVMVMLTRLTENGTAMCHRYWPEEGSELYHIYEVRNIMLNYDYVFQVILLFVYQILNNKQLVKAK